MRTVGDERTAVAGAVASLLAAATLSPLVAGTMWLIVAGVVVVTVMVAGIIARHLLKSPAAVAAVQLVVLIATLEVLFARSRLLDGAGAVTALTDLLRAGFDVTRSQPPPVEATQGIILLAAGGTGVVAYLVDVLACSLRQPALAGLPLLAVYCVPAALLPDGLPWYYFIGAAVGFMLLLCADAGERIQSWGRVLSSNTGRTFGSGDGVSGLAALGSGGRRAAGAAVLAAVLLPAIMPGLGNQIIGASGTGEGDGNGKGSSITRINPILNLRSDLNSGQDTDIITYRTDVPDPEPLRIVTDDVFNGERWEPNKTVVARANKVQEGMPPAPGLSADVRTVARTTQIRIQRQLDQTYLPLPYPATRVDIRGEWLYDPATLNVIGLDVRTPNQDYTVEHEQVQPTAEQLANAPSATPNMSPVYLSLPDRLPPIIRQTTEEVAKTGTQFQQAVRIQRWLRESGGFTYSTEAPGNGRDDSSTDAIALFLQDKRGYCVHFASTMAVMARMLNIPARVAVGFLPGEKQADGSRVISVHDAHAWPELYFEGVGWVRFEPTPRDNSTIAPEWTIPPSGTLPEDPLPSSSAQPVPSASASATPSRAPVTAAPGQSAGDTGGSGIPWRVVLVVLVLAGLAITPWLAVQVSSARRWRGASTPAARAEAAWTELRLGLEDLGATWAWTWTPRVVQERLGAEYALGDAGISALARLASAIEAARYAPPGSAIEPDPLAGLSADLAAESVSSDPGDTGHSERSSGLRDDVRIVLRRIAATMPRGRRWRARWAAPSAGAALRSLLTLRRDAGPEGPDAETLAAGSGKDTIDQEPTHV